MQTPSVPAQPARCLKNIQQVCQPRPKCPLRSKSAVTSGREGFAAISHICACLVEDGLDCLKCDTEGAYGSEVNGVRLSATNGANDCSCPLAQNARLVEFSSTGQRVPSAEGKRCETCPEYTYANPANPYECSPCPLAASLTAAEKQDLESFCKVSLRTDHHRVCAQ
jgi:hypothetical protein